MPRYKYRVRACKDKENVYSASDVNDALHDLVATEGPLDGDRPREDNHRRAQRAMSGVVAYAEQDGIFTGESFFLAVSDMLSDMRHLLDFTRKLETDGYPKTLEELAERGIMHYEAEIEGVL